MVRRFRNIQNISFLSDDITGVAKVMFSIGSVGSVVAIPMMHWTSLYRAPSPRPFPGLGLLPDMGPQVP